MLQNLGNDSTFVDLRDSQKKCKANSEQFIGMTFTFGRPESQVRRGTSHLGRMRPARP